MSVKEFVFSYLQGGGGRLGRLLKEVLKVVGGSSSHKVEVVSLYGSTFPHPRQQRPRPSHDDRRQHSDSDRYRHNPPHATSATATSADGGEEGREQESAWLPPPPPSACVWLSVVGPGGVFMDPTKLLGLLGLHLRQVRQGRLTHSSCFFQFSDTSVDHHLRLT